MADEIAPVAPVEEIPPAEVVPEVTETAPPTLEQRVAWIEQFLVNQTNFITGHTLSFEPLK